MRNLHTGGPNVCIDGLQLVPWTAVFSWSHGQQSSAGPMDSSSGGPMDYQRKPWTLLYGLSKEALDSVEYIQWKI